MTRRQGAAEQEWTGVRPYLLIDFGSTYTKLTAVDLAQPAIIGTASALTTVTDGLHLGYQHALQRLAKKLARSLMSAAGV